MIYPWLTLISWKVQRKCIRLSLSSSDMPLVHRCEVLHLALAKLDPLLSDWGSFYLLQPPTLRSTGFPPLFLDLLYRSFLSTRPCILRVCDLFPHFCLLCICYDIRLFLPNYGCFSPQARISQPWRNFHLSVFFLLSRRFLTFFLQRILWNYGILSIG